MALLSRLIPALLLSMFINTFFLSNSGAHLLSYSLTLFFISVLSHFFLDVPTVLHVRNIITLFFMLQLTLGLAFLGVFSVTFLFILSVTFLLIFILTLLFRYFLTLLLWNRLSLGYLNCMALLFWFVVYFSVPHSLTLLFILSGALFVIGGHFMWHLYGITFLSRFIPALFFPYCSTGRYTAVRATNQKQEYQYLHDYQCGC